MSEPLGINTTLSHYRIVSKIGAGGMGEVYLAQDTKLNRKVAIKFLPESLTADEQAIKRLVREAQAAARLDHPNICTIHEVSEADGRSFIVMQYIEGETLDSRMKRKPLDLSESLGIAAQVADALAEAHAHGIVHRDIKPSNIMITPRGKVKVLDFGLAKSINADVAVDAEAQTATLLTQSGVVMGTVPYMSPEQLRGERLDGRSDIFSYGTVLYEIIGGRRPFEAQSLAEITSAILMRDPPPLQSNSNIIPAKLESLILRCLEKEPAQRYQTMVELLVDLDRVRSDRENGSVVAASNDAPTVRMAIDRSRRRVNWRRLAQSRVAAAFGVLVILGLAITGYLRFFRSPTTSNKSITKYESSPAYDTYLRAKVVIKSESQDEIENAIKLLKQALAIDPQFAPAWAALARAYNIKSFYFSAPEEQRKQLNEDAAVAVEKALSLDPNLAEGHYARGLILWTHANRFPHEAAIQSYRRALELDPNLDEAHHQLGVVYFHIGLFDKSWAEIEKAVSINASNTLARFRFGVINMYRGKYEDANAVFKSTPLKSNPSLWAYQSATALFRLGRTEEANQLLDEYLKNYPHDEGGVGTSVRAMMLAKAGKFREAEAAIQRALEIGRGFGHFHHTAYNIASAYALMNQPALAIKWLQNAADDGFPCYPLFANDTNLDSLRNDLQFIAFMTKLKQQCDHYQATL
jgi:tetratricopeptide (TPR) repeat protein/predicted Ser/Thr protein kinase